MRFSFTLTVLALAATAAHAGRPLVTEDAGVLDRGDCEWESVAARDTARSTPTTKALSTQVACGLGWGSQLALAIGHSRAGGQTSRNLSLGAKTRLIDGGEDGPSLTLAYGAAWVRDSADGDRTQPELASANLVLSAPLADGWTGHANLGPTHYRDGQVTRTTWALAAENDLSDQLGWGLEAYGEDGSCPWLGAGLRWDASSSLNLNVSFARQAGADRARLITLGAKLAF